MVEQWSIPYRGDVVDPSLTGYLVQVLTAPLDKVKPKYGVLRIVRDEPDGQAVAIIGLRAWNDEQRDYCQAAPEDFEPRIPKGYTTSRALYRKVRDLARKWRKTTEREAAR